LTPVMIIIAINLITLMSDVHVQQAHLRGWFVKEKLELSCSLDRDQIYNYHCHDFHHNMRCFLNLT